MFLSSTNVRRGPTEDIETLKEAFSLIDMDGSGGIGRAELKTLLQSFARAGEAIDEAEIDYMIGEADVDGDGSISYDEFAKVLMADGDSKEEES